MSHTTRNYALVFDFDGTLADYRQDDCRDEEIARMAASYLGTDDWSAIFMKLRAATSDFTFAYSLSNKHVGDIIYNNILKKNLENIYIGKCRHPDGALEILRELIQNYRLFVLSGRDPKSLEAAMDAGRFTPHFEEILSSDGHFPPKPDPMQLLDLCQRHNIDPQKLVYIGDSDSDYLLTLNTNCYFIRAVWLRNVPIKFAEPWCESFWKLPKSLEAILKPTK